MAQYVLTPVLFESGNGTQPHRTESTLQLKSFSAICVSVCVRARYVPLMHVRVMLVLVIYVVTYASVMW